MTQKTLLLINLGTPEAPRTPEVARYLREFLMDPYVIDLPWVLRWPLVNLMIVPRRAPQSAHAYQQTWTDRGSPLLDHTDALAQRVRENLPETWDVVLAMRYAQPSIRSGLTEIREKHGAETEIFVLPLYPHHADSTVTTSLLEVKKQARRLGLNHFKELPVFFDRDFFIETWFERIRESRAQHHWDHLLLSYHGLPERHLKKTESHPGHCLNYEGCCLPFRARNQDCYRAQCLETSRRISTALGYSEDMVSTSFQSRLGRAKWIPPYTDTVIRALAQNGVRRLAVACPSFVADCLETLEEIGLRARELFLASGGEEFTLIPCPNANERWAQGLARWVQEFDRP